MTSVQFTSHLQMHLECPTLDVHGETVRDVLEEVFSRNPKLRGYLLDDQHRLRQHVVIFIDDQVIQDRCHLKDPVTEHSEIYVMQALSGG